MAPRTTIDFARVGVLVGCVVLGVLAWEVQFLWPLKLLAVLGHETGHAAATLLAGGSVNEISVRPNESGQCLSMIPEGFLGRVLVSSGGYVGGAVIAALLLLLTFRWNAGRLMLGLASGWLVVTGLLWARDLFTFGFCAVMALAFGVGARKLPLAAVSAINLFMATFTALYAVLDLKDDLWNRAVRAQSDAQILADATGIPAVLWAAVWTALSVVVVAVGAFFAVRRREGSVPGLSRAAASGG